MGTSASSRWSRAFWHGMRALQVVLSLELGLLLLVLPWTAVWTRNYFVQHASMGHGLVGHWLLSSYLRGAVSGLGLMNLWLGTGEVTQFRR